MIKLVSIVLPVKISKDGITFYFKTRKSDDDFAGLLEFPGGKIEKGETPKDAAIREFNEECLISLSPQWVKDFSLHKFSYPEFSVWLYSFFFDVSHLKESELASFENVFFKFDEEDIKINTLEANFQIIKDFIGSIKVLDTHE